MNFQSIRVFAGLIDMDYTIFYRDSWMLGSHMITSFKFIKLTSEYEGEGSRVAFERITGNDSNCIEYVVIGHPEIEDEEREE